MSKLAPDQEALLLQRLRDADTAVAQDGSVHRLYGVDAPELSTEEGVAASILADKLARGAHAEPTGIIDRYGRHVSNIELEGGRQMAEVLIERGLAHHSKYARGEQNLAEAQARRTSAQALGFATPNLVNQDPTDISGTRPMNVRERGGEFERAMARGGDTLQQLIFSAGNVGASFIGDMIGTEALDEWGLEGLEHNVIEAALNPATVESWDDVESLSTLTDYIVEAFGEQVPNLLSLIGTGGVGGLAAKQAVKAGVGKRLAQLALKTKNVSELAKAMQKGNVAIAQAQKVGNLGGVAAGSYVMGVGENGQELREAGIDSPGTALAGGVPFALLDTIGFQQTIGRLFRGIDTRIATQSVKDIGKSVFKAAGFGTAAESSTEMLQEVITLSARALHDPTFEIFSDENLARIKEAGIKAGIVGGLLGGGATGVNKATSALLQREAPEILPDETPTQPEGTTTDMFSGEATIGAVPQEEIVAEAAAEVSPDQLGLQFQDQLDLDFGVRDTDYGYIPDNVSTAANVVYSSISPEENVPLQTKAVLQHIDTELSGFESRIRAHDAFLQCLSQ